MAGSSNRKYVFVCQFSPSRERKALSMMRSSCKKTNKENIGVTYMITYRIVNVSCDKTWLSFARFLSIVTQHLESFSRFHKVFKSQPPSSSYGAGYFPPPRTKPLSAVQREITRKWQQSDEKKKCFSQLWLLEIWETEKHTRTHKISIKKGNSLYYICNLPGCLRNYMAKHV